MSVIKICFHTSSFHTRPVKQAQGAAEVDEVLLSVRGNWHDLDGV